MLRRLVLVDYAGRQEALGDDWGEGSTHGPGYGSFLAGEVLVGRGAGCVEDAWFDQGHGGGLTFAYAFFTTTPVIYGFRFQLSNPPAVPQLAFKTPQIPHNRLGC